MGGNQYLMSEKNENIKSGLKEVAFYILVATIAMIFSCFNDPRRELFKKLKK